MVSFKYSALDTTVISSMKAQRKIVINFSVINIMTKTAVGPRRFLAGLLYQFQVDVRHKYMFTQSQHNWLLKRVHNPIMLK